MSLSDDKIPMLCKALASGIGILQAGLVTASSAGDIDRMFWSRAYTNLCLQEAYSNPRATEALALVGQTANSVCGCGGNMMAATLTINEATFYAVNRQMRGDTKIRWRKGLVECVHANTQ